MNKARLQEIKDSIEFQYTLAKAKGYDNALLFTNEEEELVEEIERLQDMDKILRNENINLKLRINKAIEYIKSHTNNCMFELRIEEMEELLKILDKVESENNES